jgi:probable phosphoglycerate mutase
MKELLIIRHGEASHLARGLTGGWSASDLTELGYKQAFRTGAILAEMLGNKTFELYSSDLPRAAQTAHEIARSLSVQPQFTQALRELNNGIAANLTLEEAARVVQPMTAPAIDWLPYPEAETWRMMSQRVHVFLEDLAGRDTHAAVLVTHGHASVSAVFWWLRLGPEHWNRISFHFCPCSITYLGIDAWDERTIYKLNDTSHLSDLPSRYDRPDFR